MAETRYRRYNGIREEKGEIPRVIHEVDQFYWYRDAMERTFRDLGNLDTSEREQLLSAVRFDLPYVPRRMAPAYLMVVGDGLGICNVYLVQIGGRREILTGKIPKQKSRCLELFSYSDEGGGYPDPEDRELERSLPLRFGRIFTTDIAPFLKGSDYPLECDRVYEVAPSYNFDRIRIIAENREDREKQRLRIIWVPDKRDGEEKEIVTMGDLEWCTKEFKSEFSTRQFTFSDSINALYP